VDETGRDAGRVEEFPEEVGGMGVGMLLTGGGDSGIETDKED
jgi:hypothetical protein